MSEVVTPIRKDVDPKLDEERELLDWCMTQVRRHKKHCSPTSVAIVLLGHTDDGKFITTINSWSLDEKRTRIETCSVASTLLLQRAMGD